MPSSVPPAGGPVPRPRRRPAEPPPINGQPRAKAAEAQLTEAIENLHLAARAAGLPKVRLDWDKPAEGEADAKTMAFAAYNSQLFGDLEAAGAGPFPEALPDLIAPADPDAYLVEGLIRPGTTVMLTGPPGSAKSWAARQLAMGAAAGLRLFLDRYPITRRLNVLVIDEDNGPDEEWRRDETLLTHLGLTRPDLSGLRRLSLPGLQLDKPEWQSWLRGQIRLYEIDLLMLDPISEMHGGKELRDDPGFRSMLSFLKRLKVDFPRLASLLVHHTRKVMPGDRGSNRGLDDVRGQWGQTPDVVALMWPLGERRVAWETHKRVPHSRLILEATEAGPLEFVADETTSRDRRMVTDDKVLAAIEGGFENAADIIQATGLSKAGVYKALGRLSAGGIISKRAPYQLLEGD